MGAFIVGLVALLFVGGLPAAEEQKPSAVPTPRPAWQWTDEERLAARFSPARLTATASASGRSPQARQGSPVFQDIIDGAKDPHLFLPAEVFSHFVLLMYRPGAPPPSAREEQRRNDLSAQLDASDLPPNFRAVLTRETARYVDLQVKYRAAMAERLAQRPRRGDADADRVIRSEFQRADREHCRALGQALSGLRDALGETGYQAFLRFLYRNVAPRLSVQYEGDVSHETELRDLAGGCK